MLRQYSSSQSLNVTLYLLYEKKSMFIIYDWKYTLTSLTWVRINSQWTTSLDQIDSKSTFLFQEWPWPPPLMRWSRRATRVSGTENRGLEQWGPGSSVALRSRRRCWRPSQNLIPSTEVNCYLWTSMNLRFYAISFSNFRYEYVWMLNENLMKL